MQNVSLHPQPRSIQIGSGTLILRQGRRIVLESDPALVLMDSGRRLQAGLRKFAQMEWELSAAAGPTEETGAVLRLVPEHGMHEQGYELSITGDRILVEARTAAGIFYGVCTLLQLLQQADGQLLCLTIADWPDFKVRGVMLDVSRDKVPTMETLLVLVDTLASWKINQLQLYTEHTFAYRNHPEVWANASPLTGQEILELDSYCRARHIELVPNQNSFGHMHRWLRHARYAPLAELTGTFSTPWGPMDGPFSLCPGDPGSLSLVQSMYDELLPHFSSPMFNVGCDETLDVGQGRSSQACLEQGGGRVYLDFLLKIYDEVKLRGRRMQFWGDIIVEHPELIPELPKDSIALEWGYEADHSFATHCPQFAASELQFYVCPGTSAWCSIAGRTDNALGNLQNAAANGLAHGAAGYLITDWGDRGHWQMQPISYLGFAAGAAYAWAWETNHSCDIAQAISLHAFRDPTGSMGKVAYDLGNVYRIPGLAVPNGSALFWILQLSFKDLPLRSWPEPTQFKEALAVIDRAMQPINREHMDVGDAALITGEFEWTARLLRHACRRALLAFDTPEQDRAQVRRELNNDMQQIIREYEQIWLARNRPGGLADSVARFEQARLDYLD